MDQATARDLNEAQRLHASGRVNEAYALLVKAMPKAVHDADANTLMGVVLSARADHRGALPYFRKAATLRPLNAAALSNLGKVLTDLGRTDEALEVLHRSVAQHPGDAVTRMNLVEALLLKQAPADALPHARAAVESMPGDSSPLVSLAACLQMMGRAEEAAETLDRALALNPADHRASSWRAFVSNYQWDVPAERSLALHRDYGRVVDALVAREASYTGPVSCTPADAGRMLRVGFLSPDLRSHAVAHFLEPLVEGLKTPSLGIETLAFSTTIQEDQVSRRLKRHFKQWRNVAALGPTELRDAIRRERTDILVELTGHTALHRLPLMNMRPAPVQVTYLGYPNTTGMDAVDYRIVDGVSDPPGRGDSLAVEKLLRIEPSFLCYRAPEAALRVPVEPRPSDGEITFGSFNALQKLSDPLIARWSRLVREVNGSSLIVKTPALADGGARADLLSRFVRAGMDPGRLELIGYTASAAEHFAVYGRVDIALDSFPYHGTTTTFDTLAMGVPVVTIEGDRHASRVGCSILRALGLEELIAPSVEELVPLVRRLVGDRARLSAARGGLRERLTASVLCDAAGFAAKFAGVLRDAWHRRCGVG